MAKSCSWAGRRALAAATGCLALLLCGCSAMGSAGSREAPLALLPSAKPGIGSAADGRDHPNAASPGPAASAGPKTSPVTAYFVMVDDGGRHGIRFGCNDSLVGFAQPGDGGNVPLKAAIGALLGGGQPANAYNALGASRLTFLSGSFDGTTVTVYLSGTLNHGGSCDLPRVEAQLTQTALEATGAVKAEIYINGETLSDYLARMSRSR